MSAKLSFATLAHFALEGAGVEIATRLTVYESLAEVASVLNLPSECLCAQDAAKSIRLVDSKQAEFDALIKELLARRDGQ